MEDISFNGVSPNPDVGFPVLPITVPSGYHLISVDLGVSYFPDGSSFAENTTLLNGNYVYGKPECVPKWVVINEENTVSSVLDVVLKLLLWFFNDFNDLETCLIYKGETS